jgi:hypothetical protein
LKASLFPEISFLLSRKESTLQCTRLLKPVRPEDSHRQSFIRTGNDLLLSLMLIKAATQFLKQK